MIYIRSGSNPLISVYQVKKKKGMSVGYWGSEEFKPEFWPREIPFRPPTTNKGRYNNKILF